MRYGSVCCNLQDLVHYLLWQNQWPGINVPLLSIPLNMEFVIVRNIQHWTWKLVTDSNTILLSNRRLVKLYPCPILHCTVVDSQIGLVFYAGREQKLIKIGENNMGISSMFHWTMWRLSLFQLGKTHNKILSFRNNDL